MYKDYKVVIVTPAGREEYLSFFKKYIYKEMDKGLVDEWQLWLNTVKGSDIQYLQSMEAENPMVKVYRLDKQIIPQWRNTNAFLSCQFLQYAQADDTIYIRLDDDIVWYEPGCIEKIAQARIDHPLAFAIYPNVVNSTTVNRWHQENGALDKSVGECKPKKDDDPNWNYLDAWNYSDSKFADHIHTTFRKHYTEGTLSAYYLPSRSLDDFQRFSICGLCWWGKDHIVSTELEEAQLSWELPRQFNRPIWFAGDALMVHYAYHTQIEYFESQGNPNLNFYRDLAK